MNRAALFLFFVLFSVSAFAFDTLGSVYGGGTTVCQQSSVDSTNANPITVPKSGLYEVRGYVSNTDFTGVAIKCLQGSSSVTVNGVNGWKVAAGASVVRFFGGGKLTISCQTGSSAGYYDVCYQDQD